MGSDGSESRFSVSGLVELVRGKLERRFPAVAVEGEVSNFQHAQSGHLYFSLKDRRAQLRCVMFRSDARLLRFAVADGQHLLVRGALTIYPERGDFQLQARSAEPLGAGRLAVAFEQLKLRLAADGLFHAARKRPLPALPGGIGVVTSRTGAALSDILQVLERRHSSLRVVIAPVPVQGDGAEHEIAAGIDSLGSCAGIDVIIVGRGGGSIEDLWPFNTETVARAIARSRVPVISAVGHETDVTIADLVADLRAPTPSAAAELVARSKEEMAERVSAQFYRLETAARRAVSAQRLRLIGLVGARGLRRVETLPQRHLQRLDDLSQRLDQSLRRRLAALRATVVGRQRELALLDVRSQLTTHRRRLETARERLLWAARKEILARRNRCDRLNHELDALSPVAILNRGYAIATRDGIAVRRASEVAPGQVVHVRLGRGSLVCRIDDIVS